MKGVGGGLALAVGAAALMATSTTALRSAPLPRAAVARTATMKATNSYLDGLGSSAAPESRGGLRLLPWRRAGPAGSSSSSSSARKAAATLAPLPERREDWIQLQTKDLVELVSNGELRKREFVQVFTQRVGMKASNLANRFAPVTASVPVEIASGEELSTEQRAFLDDTLRDFRREGMDLGAEDRARLLLAHGVAQALVARRPRPPLHGL